MPAYNVYEGGKLIKGGVEDVKEYWDDGEGEGEGKGKGGHVGFLIGCSFSFESALTASGLQPRHQKASPDGSRNVSMYRTTTPLLPSGVFRNSTMVVSMRSYKRKDVDKVRQITKRFGLTHGAPVAWGWEGMKELGIRDIGAPEWGDVPVGWDAVGGRFVSEEGEGALGEGEEEEIPVFWGCGVTPQEAVMRAGQDIKGFVMGHAPGYMLVLDLKDGDICS